MSFFKNVWEDFNNWSKSGKRGKRKAETNEEKGIWDGNFPDQDNIGKMLKN
jgi:hypothetical protein